MKRGNKRGKEQEQDNYNPNNKFNNSKFNKTDTNVKKGNKGLKIVLVIIGLIVVVFLVLGLIMRFTVNKTNNNNNSPPPNIEVPIEEDIEEPIEETPTTGAIEELPIVEEPVVINRMDYESKIIGIGFNYDTSMYLEENTDKVFNVLKVSSDGKDTFNILEDKIVEDLDIMSLTYQGNDKLSVTLSLKQVEEEFEFSIDSISTYINDIYNIQEIIEEVEEVEESEEVDKKDNKKNKTKPNKKNEEEENEEEIEEVIDNRIIVSSFEETSPIQIIDTQNETIVSEYLIVQNGISYKIIRGYVSLGVNVLEVVIQTDGDLEGIDTYGIFEKIVNSLEVIREGV